MHPRKPHVVVPLDEYTPNDQTIEDFTTAVSGGMNFDEFTAWEKSSRDVIDVKRIYIDITGDLVCGILLSQIVYWFLPTNDGKSRLTINREDKLWIAKSRDHWWEECRITAKQFDRASAMLEGDGFIETRVFKFNGLSIKHITLNLEILFLRVKALLTKGEKQLNCPKVNLAIPQKVKAYKEAETTAETTAENNTSLLFDSKPEKIQNLEASHVEEVFKYYLSRLGRKPAMYTLTPLRMKKGIHRFRECMDITRESSSAVALMKLCVDKLAASDFHREGGYIEWDTHLFGSTEKLQMWMNRETRNGHSDPPLEDALARERRKDAERRSR